MAGLGPTRVSPTRVGLETTQRCSLGTFAHQRTAPFVQFVKFVAAFPPRAGLNVRLNHNLRGTGGGCYSVIVL